MIFIGFTRLSTKRVYFFGFTRVRSKILTSHQPLKVSRHQVPLAVPSLLADAPLLMSPLGDCGDGLVMGNFVLGEKLVQSDDELRGEAARLGAGPQSASHCDPGDVQCDCGLAEDQGSRGGDRELSVRSGRDSQLGRY